MEKEMVLLIPSVLGILGDNPMQSEIACHVGLAGKMFCHVCRVQGQDGDASADVAGAESRANSPMSMSSGGSSDGEVDAGATRKKGKETLQDLVDRARRFLGVRDRALRR